MASTPLPTAALKDFGDDLAAALGDAFKGMKQALSVLSTPLKVLGATLDVIGKTLTSVVDPAFKLLDESLKAVGKTLLSALDVARFAFAGIVGKVGDALSPVKDAVWSAFSGIADRIKDTLSPLASKVGGWLAPIGERFKKAFAGLGDSLGLSRVSAGGSGSRFGVAGKVAGNVGSGIGTAAKGLGAIAGAAGGAAGAAIALGSAIGGLVSKANPAIFERFQVALDDFQAVIGRALIPVFDVMTQVVRLAADTLTTFVSDIGSAFGSVARAVLPILQVIFEVAGHIGAGLGRVFQSLVPAFETFGAAFTSILAALQPVINLIVDSLAGVMATALGALATVLQTVAPLVVTLATVFGDMAKTVVKWIRDLLEWVGILDAEKPGTAPGSSVGAAARAANIGDPKDIIATAQKNAFTLGSGVEDPAKRTASAAEGIKATSEKILAAIQALPAEIARAIAKGTADTAVSAGSGVSEAIGFAPGRFESGLERLGLREPKSATPVSDHVKAAIDAARKRWAPPEGAGGGVVGR